MPMTKAEVYNQLICTGVNAGFYGVPEYRIKPSIETNKREADLAWCIPNPCTKDGRPWIPVGIFEIEGHDVEKRRNGSLGGIEKDTGSILSASKFVYCKCGVWVMPAAAVVLFQLAADGNVHHSKMKPRNVVGHRRRFEAHAKDLFKKLKNIVPSGAMPPNRNAVILDCQLGLRLNGLVQDAQIAANKIRRDKGCKSGITEKHCDEFKNP